MLAALGAAAVGVIDRVHGDRAHRRALALPAHAAGLAEHHVGMIGVGHGADRSHALLAHAAGFAGAQLQERVAGVAANELDAVPQGYISGEVAQDACNAAGKRLCTTDEWLRACRGPNDRTYPYGYAYQPGVCNEGRSVHPVIELFGTGATFNATELNDPLLNQLPDSLAPSGAYTGCVTDEGVYDLHGNLHEWIDDPAGTFRGGFYVDATINGPGCTYRTTAHTFDYHDYSTGFRCCMDAP